MRKTVRIINRCIDAGLMILFLAAFLVGGYAMYDSYLVYGHANDKSLLKFRPAKKEEFSSTIEQISENVVAWLTVTDTNIDFPVMQGKTNTEYLNKDPYGKYSLAGSIFLDSRNESDFSDSYSLIYGHHMEEGAMFGALDDFLNENFFKAHTKGKLITKKDEYDITFFAVCDTSAEESSIFDPKGGGGPEKYIREHYRYLLGTLEEGKKLIALSTCKYPDTVDRTVIFGYMTKTEPGTGESGTSPMIETVESKETNRVE